LKEYLKQYLKQVITPTSNALMQPLARVFPVVEILRLFTEQLGLKTLRWSIVLLFIELFSVVNYSDSE